MEENRKRRKGEKRLREEQVKVKKTESTHGLSAPQTLAYTFQCNRERRDCQAGTYGRWQAQSAWTKSRLWMTRRQNKIKDCNWERARQKRPISGS